MILRSTIQRSVFAFRSFDSETNQGKPSTKPVFSRRLKFTESHVAYAPVEEYQHGRAFSGPSAEKALQARVRYVLALCEYSKGVENETPCPPPPLF